MAKYKDYETVFIEVENSNLSDRSKEITLRDLKRYMNMLKRTKGESLRLSKTDFGMSINAYDAALKEIKSSNLSAFAKSRLPVILNYTLKYNKKYKSEREKRGLVYGASRRAVGMRFKRKSPCTVKPRPKREKGHKWRFGRRELLRLIAKEISNGVTKRHLITINIAKDRGYSYAALEQSIWGSIANGIKKNYLSESKTGDLSIGVMP